MSENLKYGLEEITLEKIRSVFSSFSQIESAILYGSRAKGNYKLGSDIDIVLTGEKIDIILLTEIKSELDDLLLPYIIDVTVHNMISNKDLLDHIQRVGVKIYDVKRIEG